MSFANFLEQSMLELREKQAKFSSAFEAIGADSSTYEYNLVEGWIKWLDSESNAELLKYKIASVGSYKVGEGTWQWSWGKQVFSDEERILLVKQISILAEAFPDSKDLLNPRPMKKDEFYGQEIASALVKLLDGEAIYNASYDEDGEYWLYLVLIKPIK